MAVSNEPAPNCVSKFERISEILLPPRTTSENASVGVMVVPSGMKPQVIVAG